MGAAGSEMVVTVSKNVFPVLPPTVSTPTRASVIVLLRIVPLLPSMAVNNGVGGDGAIVPCDDNSIKNQRVEDVVVANRSAVAVDENPILISSYVV